ncbi:MAG: tetratricopeptide repeat protein [Deltaproteobacteria bacterium]|nr:tetratricopeptide repeat protein [Deltaproteobacteria bacterium]
MADAGLRSRLFCASVPCLIFALTVLPFSPALRNEFVNWDDIENLLENPNYRGLGWIELRWMFTTFYMSNYRPLTWMTYGLDYLLWGMAPFGYHLTSLFLHAASAVVFYFVALRLLRLALPAAFGRGEIAPRASAGLAALVFAIHPLRVEAVAWASARNDVLSGFLLLWTVLCYLRAVVPAQRHAIWRGWMIAAVGIYGLSLFAKGTGMVLPAALLVLDVYPLRRLGGGPGKWFGLAVRRVWWEKAPFLLLAAAAGLVALVAKHGAQAMRPLEQYGALPRLAQALYGLAFYLWKTIVPLNLSPLYPLPISLKPWDLTFLASGFVVLLCSVVFYLFRRRWPAGLAVWVSYVVILLPVLGFAQSGPQIVADRYSYLAGLGWAVLIGSGLLCLCENRYSRRISRQLLIFAVGLTATLLAGVGALTWKQVSVWRDSETLWRYALDIGQESSFARNNLGFALVHRGQLEESIGHFRQALRIDPAFAGAHSNLGFALAGLGRVGEAVDHYREALRINPAHSNAHNNLGVALGGRGRLEEGVEHFREAVRINPAHAAAHNNLGSALLLQGKLEEAIAHFRQALRIQPGFTEAHENLRLALGLQGQKVKRKEKTAQP